MGYRLRLAEAFRTDRVRSYGNYIRLINSFPMKIRSALELDEDAEVAARFLQFQEDVQAASTELFVVGTRRTATAAVALGRALSDRTLWEAVEAWAKAPENRDARRRFLDAYLGAVRGPRQSLLHAMRRDLRLTRLRGVTLEDAETLRRT